MQPQEETIVQRTYKDAANEIRQILQTSDVLTSDDDEKMIVMSSDQEIIMRIVPTLDLKITNPIMFHRNEEGRFCLKTVLIDDGFANLRRNDVTLVDIDPIMSEWFNNKGLDVIAYATSGCRFTHTTNGSVLFGIGMTPLMVFHNLDLHPESNYHDSWSYKNRQIGVELTRKLLIETTWMSSALENMALALLPRAAVLLTAFLHGKHDRS